jgi:phosphate-selective porin OprO/OprP
VRAISVCLLLALIAGAAAAQVVDPQNVVIRNAHIAAAGAGDALVNLLIRDNKLELISRDPIPTPERFIALDADGGYIVGDLSIGETPRFIIVDADPRKDFDVLFDSNAHTVFAVHEGALRKNTLLYVERALEETEEEPERPGWLAYTPPPLAMPTSYGDPSKWNQWETANTTGIFTGAVVLDRQHWLSQNTGSEQQVGNLDAFNGGEIRALRFGAVGTLGYFDRPWVYTIFGATNSFDKGFEIERQDDFSWFDYRLDIPLTDDMTLSIGKQKEPISMERVMSMVQLPMQERSSVSDAFLPARNFGAVLSGTVRDRRMTWAAGLFNNFIDSEQSIGSTATQATGRITWLPLVSEDENNLVHLGLGARFSNGKQGAQYFTEPEFNKSPVFVDTELLDSGGQRQVNIEASWRTGPFWLAGEYVSSEVESVADGDLEFSGWHLTGSWILTGEMRGYNYKSGILGPVPVARSVYQGGWGAWEVAARYSSLDLADGPIDGGNLDILSLGINWWLSPIFNVNVNYRFITNERSALDGDAQGVMARLLLMLD